MYKVIVMHYGKQPQVMDGCEFDNQEAADRCLQQQAEIMKGYKKRTGWVEGHFCVFGSQDRISTRMWVREDR